MILEQLNISNGLDICSMKEESICNKNCIFFQNIWNYKSDIQTIINFLAKKKYKNC
jgi:hypothetical protein